MKYFYLLAIPFLLLIASCNQKPPTIHERFLALNEADSLALMDSLLGELKVEMYSSDIYRPIEMEIAICDISERNFMRISVNESKKIMIQGQIADNIHDKIVEFFMSNFEKNHLDNNFPLYSRIDKEELLGQIEESKRQAIAVEQAEGAAQDLIDFKWAQVEEWKSKLKTLEALSVDTLLETLQFASVQVNYPSPKDTYIIDSIIPAFYTLRNYAAIRYLDETYIELAYRYSISKSEKAKDKLDALKALFPIKVIDLPYCREHNISNYYIHVEAPPPPPMPSDY